MDKNTIIGLVLMVAVFVCFSFYQSNEMEKQAEVAAERAKIEKAEQQKRAAERAEREQAEMAMSETERQMRDSMALAAKHNEELYRHGEKLTKALHATSALTTVENDLFTVIFDSRGGKIVDVTLKNYTRFAEGERTELIKMMSPGSAYMGIDLYRNGSDKALNTNNYVFTPTITETEQGCRVTMSLDVAYDASVEYIYDIYDTGDASRDYLIDFDIKTTNINPYLNGKEQVVMRWANKSNHNERSFQNEGMATTIAYLEDGDVEELDSTGEKESAEDVEWVALKQQYFTSAILSAEPMKATMSFKSGEEGDNYLKSYTTSLTLPLNGNATQHFAFYYGPNDFKIMRDVTFEGKPTHLEDVIPMGGTLIGWVNRYFTIPIFHWLRDHGLNFGIIILILTILVKLIILPLTYKSYMSTAKMRAIRPELEQINLKFPNQEDAMKKQQATMELYQKVGISPMSGCLPLLIQMPILWAMFRFFPASIELRGESFLWAEDLSAYDSVLQLPIHIPFYGDHVSLFALLMAAALFGYSFVTYKQQSATTAGQPGAGMMKFMMVYFMPVMMLGFFNSYSSGLCYYYFISQVLTMIIMWAIRRSVNDEKVREKLLSHKPKKKSRFQERYEEALRQQQEQLNREQRRQRR